MQKRKGEKTKMIYINKNDRFANFPEEYAEFMEGIKSMNLHMRRRVDSLGRLVIPMELRRELDIQPQDELCYVRVGSTVLIWKAEDGPSQPEEEAKKLK